MLDNGALDFRSVDIFSAADDHVFDAVTDEKIACVVEIARITRQQEAILGERLGAFFWPVPIANHRCRAPDADFTDLVRRERSEEHTSELQSLMRTSYDVFCLKKIKKKQ